MTEDGEVRVILSRRNLLSLLHKLTWPGSARTLWCDVPEYDKTLVLRVEDDEQHYGHPSRQGQRAGKIHPDTETYLGAHG